MLLTTNSHKTRTTHNPQPPRPPAHHIAASTTNTPPVLREYSASAKEGYRPAATWVHGLCPSLSGVVSYYSLLSRVPAWWWMWPNIWNKRCFCKDRSAHYFIIIETFRVHTTAVVVTAVLGYGIWGSPCRLFCIALALELLPLFWTTRPTHLLAAPCLTPNQPVDPWLFIK